MKTLITNVTIQVNDVVPNSKYTVFTYYKNGSNEYQGFNVFDSLEDAEKSATNLSRCYNDNFMSTVNGYFVKTFFKSGERKEKFVKS